MLRSSLLFALLTSLTWAAPRVVIQHGKTMISQQGAAELAACGDSARCLEELIHGGALEGWLFEANGAWADLVKNVGPQRILALQANCVELPATQGKDGKILDSNYVDCIAKEGLRFLLKSDEDPKIKRRLAKAFESAQIHANELQTARAKCVKAGGTKCTVRMDLIRHFNSAAAKQALDLKSTVPPLQEGFPGLGQVAGPKEQKGQTRQRPNGRVIFDGGGARPRDLNCPVYIERHADCFRFGDNRDEFEVPLYDPEGERIVHFEDKVPRVDSGAIRELADSFEEPLMHLMGQFAVERIHDSVNESVASMLVGANESQREGVRRALQGFRNATSCVPPTDRQVSAAEVAFALPADDSQELRAQIGKEVIDASRTMEDAYSRMRTLEDDFKLIPGRRCFFYETHVTSRGKDTECAKLEKERDRAVAVFDALSARYPALAYRDDLRKPTTYQAIMGKMPRTLWQDIAEEVHSDPAKAYDRYRNSLVKKLQAASKGMKALCKSKTEADPEQLSALGKYALMKQDLAAEFFNDPEHHHFGYVACMAYRKTKKDEGYKDMLMTSGIAASLVIPGVAVSSTLIRQGAIAGKVLAVNLLATAPSVAVIAGASVAARDRAKKAIEGYERGLEKNARTYDDSIQTLTAQNYYDVLNGSAILLSSAMPFARDARAAARPTVAKPMGVKKPAAPTPLPPHPELDPLHSALQFDGVEVPDLRVFRENPKARRKALENAVNRRRAAKNDHPYLPNTRSEADLIQELKQLRTTDGVSTNSIFDPANRDRVRLMVSYLDEGKFRPTHAHYSAQMMMEDGTLLTVEIQEVKSSSVALIRYRDPVTGRIYSDIPVSVKRFPQDRASAFAPPFEGSVTPEKISMPQGYQGLDDVVPPGGSYDSAAVKGTYTSPLTPEPNFSAPVAINNQATHSLGGYIGVDVQGRYIPTPASMDSRGLLHLDGGVSATTSPVSTAVIEISVKTPPSGKPHYWVSVPEGTPLTPAQVVEIKRLNEEFLKYSSGGG